jgi:cytochrome c-type biogenesis protein CcmF
VIIETGHFALILALVVAVFQTIAPAWGAYKRDEALMKSGDSASYMQLLLITVAFLALVWVHVTSDFTVENVVRNSHSTKPMLYKISGVWANHEGSMVLWVLILSVFGAAVALVGRNLPLELKANVLAVQASISTAFLIFIIATSNPFLRLEQPPMDGMGLNPILQDPALAFHPPFLYGGYVGFSMAFSFAIAALLSGHIDAAWARWVRPWTLAAWMMLTMGIAMGSWWAYYELGWGGFWFWDPVENASLMPWLSGTALLHSALVMEKREALKVWTILLAILTFSLSLMGTFLVRSGVLTSVHSFAVDPARGVFVLGILTFFTAGGLALYAWRAPMLRQGGLFAPISREGSLVFNNLLLTTSCAVVFTGTLYPLALEAVTGEKISVGAPYFNNTFVPLMVPLFLAMPFGPLLAWKRGDIRGVTQRLSVAIVASVLVLLGVYAVKSGGPLLAPFGVALGVWLMLGALSDTAFRIKLVEASPEESLRRLFNLPGAHFGAMLSHFGLGMMVVGVIATTAWRMESIVAMKPGQQIELNGYNLTFAGVSVGRGPNYEELSGAFQVEKRGRAVTKLTPSKRQYDAPRSMTTEAGIYPSWAGDLYVVMGDQQDDGAYSVRAYFNPLVRLIWIGCVVLFIGGGLSLMDRRLRVGAPRKSKKTAAMPAAAE